VKVAFQSITKAEGIKERNNSVESVESVKYSTARSNTKAETGSGKGITLLKVCSVESCFNL